MAVNEPELIEIGEDLVGYVRYADTAEDVVEGDMAWKVESIDDHGRRTKTYYAHEDNAWEAYNEAVAQEDEDGEI